ncbi:hypothetical protein MPLB_1490023 [Mesorhizobium sp. ORS 3324]|nr:hypothetical protein MPLB_1490023 [Mesorhizobium sp. ORS 3324]
MKRRSPLAEYEVPRRSGRVHHNETIASSHNQHRIIFLRKPAADLIAPLLKLKSRADGRTASQRGLAFGERGEQLVLKRSRRLNSSGSRSDIKRREAVRSAGNL